MEDQWQDAKPCRKTGVQALRVGKAPRKLTTDLLEIATMRGGVTSALQVEGAMVFTNTVVKQRLNSIATSERTRCRTAFGMIKADKFR